MLAGQQPSQHMQQEPMSSTQQLMLPNDAANYDAPKGGFSADPKVPSGLAKFVLFSLQHLGVARRQRTHAGRPALNLTNSKCVCWSCQILKSRRQCNA